MMMQMQREMDALVGAMLGPRAADLLSNSSTTGGMPPLPMLGGTGTGLARTPLDMLEEALAGPMPGVAAALAPPSSLAGVDLMSGVLPAVVDVTQDEGHYYVRAELPGFSKEEVKVRFWGEGRQGCGVALRQEGGGRILGRPQC